LETKAKKIAVALLLVGLMGIGCSDAERGQFGAMGSKHKIELYSGGQMVRSWTSTGKVNSSKDSDGYYFQDEATDVNVEVSGTVVITRLK